MTGEKYAKGIAAKKETREAVGRLCQGWMMDSLIALKDYSHLVQGTSLNETFHSSLKRTLKKNGGTRTFQTVNIFMNMTAMEHNNSILEKLQTDGSGSRRATMEINLSSERIAIGNALQLGLDTEGLARRRRKLRVAWHPYMDR